MIELHLGCGEEIKESALNVDIHKLNGVDLICDLNNRWPFRSGSVDKITANHVFEHLDYDLAFSESTRVLKPNGRVVSLAAIPTPAIATSSNGRPSTPDRSG